MKLKIGLVSAVMLFAGVALAGGDWAVIDTTPSRPGTVIPAGREALTDPTGDTFGSGSPQIDITEFRGERNNMNLIVTITFDGTISPASTGNADDLYGFVDIDSDQDSGTGVVGGSSGFCGGGTPARGGSIGVDWVINLGSYDGKGEQMEVTPGIGTRGGGGSVDAVFTSNSVTITVPYDVIESTTGIVDMATVVGTGPEPTDCAPDTGALTVPVEVQSFSVE